MAGFIESLRAEGLPFTMVSKPSLRRRDLVNYANAHENVVAVVIDSREGWERWPRTAAATRGNTWHARW